MSPEEDKCPECGSKPIDAPTSTMGREGVCSTYTQEMKPYSYSTEKVCTTCGLVVDKSTRYVHR